MYWKQKPSIRQRDFGGLLVLVDSEHALVHELNEVGSEVWSCLDGGRDVEQIVQRVTAVFAVTESEARQDVERFLQRLSQLGLIERESAQEQEGT